ncbi:hypothetical protein FACS1894130_04250 [Spirochaetia bacterium]|nr:hypothetical protein FACS1894130_04250 [Spirochaetia bacterium]
MALSPLAVLIEERKTRAIETLSVQFSENRLPMEEYERLVEYIHRAESERELAIIEKIVGETVLYAGEGRGQQRPGARADSRNSGGHFWETPSNAVAGTAVNLGSVKFNFALLSSRTIVGSALAQNNCSCISLLGTNVIDIREGDLPPGKTEVDVVSILGETRIVVPPGVAVTMKALPIAGDAKTGRGVETQPRPGMPELVISGCAILGSVTVKLRKERRR